MKGSPVQVRASASATRVKTPQNRPEEEIAGYRKVLDTQNEVARFDKDGKKIEVIASAGAYVFDFLMIHPFNDGNGRLSRLLTLLLLYHAGHEIGRFISLEKLIEESKETYYESLEKSTAGWDKGKHDLWPWLNYFLGILNAAYKEFEARAGELTGGRGSKAMRIKQFVQSRAADAFTFDDVQRALPDVSADHIRTELRKLRDAGIVESPGRGRKQWRRLSS